MTSGSRKLALSVHVTTSVAWTGAVIAFLVLSIAGVTSRQTETVRAAYVSMNLIGEYAIVPLSFAALLTGLIQSLGTDWGLFRYYWIVVKLVLTVGATLLLLMHQFTMVAEAAKRVMNSTPGTLPYVGPWGAELVEKAGAAIVVLIALTVVAIYKPWGMTRYGRRKQLEEKVARGIALSDDRPPLNARLPASLKVFLAVCAVAIAVIVAMHLSGSVHHHHGH